jgi:UDP-N-acetylmuramate--alanine ligase
MHEERLMHRVKQIHFIGVGGAGMNGIAEVLFNIGYLVSGSDIMASSVTQHLKNIGIKIFIGHEEAYVKDADVVVYSSAISEGNVELVAARKNRIPVVPRAEMLAEIMRFRNGIAVAGTHGKTTTTSLIASVLSAADLDPTFVVGGLVKSANCNARLGTGKYLVAEADESDGSFLFLQPLISVITNIDADHLSAYDNDYSQLEQSFLDFSRRLPFYGVAVVCADDKSACCLIDKMHARVITYGFHDDADVRAYDVQAIKNGESFMVETSDGSFGGAFSLPMLGAHNVQNATAAIAVALELGIEKSSIQRAFQCFEGIDRRFQIYPNVVFENKSITIVDDYAHHPNELVEVLKTFQIHWPNNRQIIVFQPHRYTRTRDLFEHFVEVLSSVERLFVLEVYSAGEKSIEGCDGLSLVKAINSKNQGETVFVKDLTDIENILADFVEDNDVVALLGAGSIGGLAQGFLT